ncbi:acetate uptake transporter [Parabacteroides sp. FAFU027]|uniref:acetate uptake transporter n=1 Tax=Parabacteroides sp. FAFU027 TaxID=2922715 RepID=UPI001FAEA45D|nr:acetate uptake transporter [Parabacteroides sp. FAFU027]
MHEQGKYIRIEVADPTPLGLTGLAMVTLVAASQKLGWTEGLSMVIPWAIFLGGFAQLMACVYDFKHNNLFGSTAFGIYGFFWLSVGTAWLIKLGVFGAALAQTVDVHQLGFAFLGYLIISLFITVASFRTNKVLIAIMVLIDVLFLGLMMSSFEMGEIWHTIAAWSELFISLLGFYGAGANLLNKFYGRVMLPVGSPIMK